MNRVGELEIVREGVVVRVIPVGREPVRLGRQLDNTVVLVDEDVSGHHAVVTARQEGLHIADLRSTNGTFVNDARVNEALLAEGDLVRLGGSLTLRVRTPSPLHQAPPLLVDLTAGVVHPMLDGTVTIGSGPGCQVLLPDGPARRATVMLHHARELWLEDEEGGGSLAVGEVFEVGGHQLRVERAPSNRATTAAPSEGPLAYLLTVALNAPGGPTAWIQDPASGRRHAVIGETRATLLYALGRRRRDDRLGGVSDPAAGWMDDEGILVAVWGRAALRQAASNYSVLLHRLRKELDADGFDSTFIEKRRGATRVRLDAIELGGEGV